MQTLIIVIGLTVVAIVIFLIPALGGRDESPSSSIPNSDDNRQIGAGLNDHSKAERLVEYEINHKPATNADFKMNLIWIAVIAVAVFAVFYVSLLRY